MRDRVERLAAARAALVQGVPLPRRKLEGEGGCGVLGCAASVPVAGRHLLRPMRQMCNRGNGKGGGIAAVGLDPAQLGVDERTLRECHLVQVAYLAPDSRERAEREFLEPVYEIAAAARVPSLEDPRAVGLEVPPPLVWRYFVRPKAAALEELAARGDLGDLSAAELADELVFQTSYRLNKALYAATGEKRAFVLSHGKDMLVLKLVGFAEQVIEFYRLEDLRAHIWVGHQRYPTKGRVWHPGGAHPFVGLHEALVHNGDFANYASICEYLAQRNLRPLYLTDTEVAAMLFDLWNRTYRFALEHVIEAMAPTTERDFDLLPEEKRRVYRALQAAHVHGSPDGPWFFIVARHDVERRRCELLGITDTSMLRPQVFALQEGPVQVGVIASERQAIDAFLSELHGEDERVCPVADAYWVARGGSYTDGGAFRFAVERSDGKAVLACTDKFGAPVVGDARAPAPPLRALQPRVTAPIDAATDEGFLAAATHAFADFDHAELLGLCRSLEEEARSSRARAIRRLTLLLDRRYDTGKLKRAWVVQQLERSLESVFDAVPLAADPDVRIDWEHRSALIAAAGERSTLFLDASRFPPDREQSAARFLVDAHRLGWRRIVVYRCRGQRFLGCGLGPGTQGLRIDVHGRSGDYLASGLDGAELVVHGSGQDQLAQILGRGRLVVHGDVGQAFLYGAKGGEVFVLGDAAGRPLINAVGAPRVVINGVCLDYLAESFMAGDPLDGGGFAVLNGVRFDARGRLVEHPTPYPGANLFSLASGGAIYLRDPRDLVSEEQLNGGRFVPLAEADWRLVEPLLAENERLFGISVSDLLRVDGAQRIPAQVYRKIEAVRLRALEGV